MTYLFWTQYTTRLRSWFTWRRETTRELNAIHHDLLVLRRAEEYRGSAAIERHRQLAAQLAALTQLIGDRMATIAEKLEQLTLDVSEIGTVVESAVAAIAGLVALIADLRTQLENAGATPEVLAKFDELSTALDAHKDMLAAAIPQSTPAAPPPSEQPA